MRFTVMREAFLKPLQFTSGVVDRKQTLPVLGNLLLVVNGDRLFVTATDLEIEMVASSNLNSGEDGATTVPARKLLDICRMLPEGAEITLTVAKERATVRSGKSRFVLATLPAADFPNQDVTTGLAEFTVPQKDLKVLLDRTQFAMAQQDVRYYLNGLLLEAGPKALRCVATDGHRLALSEREIVTKIKEIQHVIIPRKAVVELCRLLGEGDMPVTVQLGTNHLKVATEEVSFTTKLIDGRFPDYERVLPQATDKTVVVDRENLRQALSRISILSNERYRSVRFQLEPGLLRVSANNPEQEEAEEEVGVDYSGSGLEIGFNASYVLDALNALAERDIKLLLSDPNSCCLIKGLNDDATKYVVMPMRL